MAGLVPVAASTEAEPSTGVTHDDAAEALGNVDDFDDGLILDPLEEDAGTTQQNIQFNGENEVDAGNAAGVAEGNEVPTYYEIEGNTLTQVVDHAGIDEGAYPAVAAPIWFSPAIAHCLMGLGLTGPDITRIRSSDAPGSMTGALGRAATACIRGR